MKFFHLVSAFILAHKIHACGSKQVVSRQLTRRETVRGYILGGASSTASCVARLTKEAREELEGHDCNRGDRQDVQRGALHLLLERVVK